MEIVQNGLIASLVHSLPSWFRVLSIGVASTPALIRLSSPCSCTDCKNHYSFVKMANLCLSSQTRISLLPLKM